MLWTDKDKPITGKETATTSAEWVPVVRCRECKYQLHGNFIKVPFCGKLSEMSSMSSEHLIHAKDDFYCADGERKDDEMVELAPTIKPLTEIDYIELADRYGGEVAFVVRDMIEKTNQRWVLLNGERKDK